jgi:hypothetical protein
MKNLEPFLPLLKISIAVVFVLGIFQMFLPAYVHPFSWYSLLYFVSLTFLTDFMIRLGIKKAEAWDFYNFTMSSMGIRLLLSAGVLFLYYYLVKENRILFTATFFIFYFLFTAFEIRNLLSILPHEQKSIRKTDEKV